MRNTWLAAAVMATTAAWAYADGPVCPIGSGCGPGGCRPAPRIRAQVLERAYTVEVAAPKYVAVVKQSFRDVPVCRTVQVRVTDCTGGIHTECREETALEHIRVTDIEVVPNPVCKVKQPRTAYCVSVTLEAAPRVAAELPLGPPIRCGGDR